MGESTLSTFKCAPCGQPATLACKGCKLEDSISRGLVATTRYCSASCQREDWLQHKAFCKAMRAIRSHQALQLEKSKPHGPESQSAQLQNHGLKHHDSANRELPPYQTHQPLANPSHQAHACASCNHPAPYTCKGCSAAPSATSGLVSATWYCSRSCQTGHWSEHKSACKAAQARRKLYEAGETLQKKYYGYCQSIVMIMLKDGSLNANHMILHEENSVQRTTDALTMLQILQRHSEEERAFLACLVGNATDEMGTTVKEHLKGKHNLAKPRTRGCLAGIPLT